MTPEKPPPPTTFEEVEQRLSELRHGLNNLRTVLTAMDDQVEALIKRVKVLEAKSGTTSE